MQCERSGEYKTPKTRKKLNLEGTGSRKCECPFRLKCFFEKNTQDWWITMFCGINYHELAPQIACPLLAGQLKADEKKRVIDMTKKPTNEHNLIIYDTPTLEKQKQELEVIEEDGDYELSLV